MFPKEQGLISFQIVNGRLEYIQSTKNNVTYHSTVQDIAVIYTGVNETTLLHFSRGMHFTYARFFLYFRTLIFFC
jgi:hypothetical protein